MCSSCSSSLVRINGYCCDPSCATCNGAGNRDCTSCRPGTFGSGGGCIPCHASCLTCWGAASNGYCLSCHPPSVLSGATCCDPSCASCSDSDTKCTSCPSGRYLSSNSCPLCDSSCLTCSGGTRTTCTSCLAPLVKVGSTCCHASCATCSGASNTDCLSCAAGKYFSNGQCLSCDSSCSACNAGGRTACTSCEPPSALKSGICCYLYCATCSGLGSTNCLSCEAGRYLSGGQCISCDSSCGSCDGAGRTACTSCTSGLVLVSGSCCHASCATCNGKSSTNCASCIDGKYLASGSCSSCDSQCSTCTGSTRTDCLSCQAPLVLKSGACCDASCASCSDTGPSDCLSCPVGKYLSGGQCLTCELSCLSCSGPASTDCLSCAAGKYLSNGQCFSCDPSCSTCGGGVRTACTSCLSPLVFVSEGGTCCDASCAGCSDTSPSDCLSCPVGKYLSGGQCLTCDLSCLSCSGSSSTDCLSCAAGKYLSNGQCFSCDPSCSTCGGGVRTACTSCLSPLVFVSGSGTCCDASCASCSDTGPSDCLSCPVGKYLSGGQCLACDLSCLGCTGAGRTACTSCGSGMALISGSCCHSSCATCSGTSNTDCASCGPGEYLSSGQCLSCDSSCLECNAGSRTACTSCLSPSVLVGTTCCDPSCTTCNGMGASNCASCGPTEYLSSGQCLSCDSSCLTCGSGGPTGCLTCPPNKKYLSGTSCYESCDSPLTASSSGGIDYCDTPCPGQFAYIEGGCGSCPPPRPQLHVNGFDVCGVFCTDTSDYYYWNATCLPACPHPLASTGDSSGVKFCNNPCGVTSTDYLFYDQSCRPNCPNPLREIQNPGVQYCLLPCKDSEFFYKLDKECHPKCEYPFKIRHSDGIKICENVLPLSLSETVKIRDNAAAIKRQGDVASGGMKAFSALNSASPASALLSGLSSMLQYIRYININYPPKIEMLFLVHSEDSLALEFNFEIPKSVVGKLDDNRLPEMFEKYEINSNFVKNMWKFLMTLGVIFILIGVLTAMKIAVPEKKFPAISVLLSKALGAIKWNGPIMVICGACGDIFFYASLNFQSFQPDSFAAVACLIVSIFLIIVVLVILMIGLKILRTFRRQRENQNWAAKWKDYEILYEGYEERSVWSLSYMLLFLVRGIIFNLTVANLYRFPLAQCIIINITNLMMFGYLLYLRPLKDLLSLVQLLINEGLFNVIGVNLLILAIMDEAGIRGQSLRLSVGDCIYFVISAFNILALIFMGLSLAAFLVFLYKTWKRFKAQKISSSHEILKAMILGQDFAKQQESVANESLESTENPGKQPINSTNEVVNMEESKIQMLLENSRLGLTIVEDFPPTRNQDIENEDNSPSFRDLSVKKLPILGEADESVEIRKSVKIIRHYPSKNRKIQNAAKTPSAKISQVMNNEEATTGKSGIEATETNQKKDRDSEGLWKTFGAVLNFQKKPKESNKNPKVFAEQVQVIKKEEKVTTEVLQKDDNDLKNKSGDDLAQDLRRLEAHRGSTHISIGHEGEVTGNSDKMT